MHKFSIIQLKVLMIHSIIVYVNISNFVSISLYQLTFSFILNAALTLAKCSDLIFGIDMNPSPPNLTLSSVFVLNLSLGLAP